jgi:hypothetical protein
MIKLPTKRPKRALPAAEEQKRMYAYNTCANDQEAGAYCQIEGNTFRTWRLKRGLPSKSPCPRLSPHQVMARVTALAAHTTLHDAARALGVTAANMRCWVRDRNYPQPASDGQHMPFYKNLLDTLLDALHEKTQAKP